MNATRIVAILLIVAGAVALAVGGFSYTKETHQAKLGPLEFSMKEKQDVNIPQWAGSGAIQRPDQRAARARPRRGQLFSRADTCERRAFIAAAHEEQHLAARGKD